MQSRYVHTLESLFKRHFWVINLVAIAVAAFLLGGAINQAVASLVLGPLTIVGGAGGDEAAANEGEYEVEDSGQLATMLQGADDAPAPVDDDDDDDDEDVVEDEEPEEPFDLPEGDCLSAAIPAVLIGTMVDPTGEYSFATIRDNDTELTRVVQIGHIIAGAEILDIDRDPIWGPRVFVRTEDGEEGCLKPGEEPSTATASRDRPSSRNNDREDPSSSSRSTTPSTRRDTPEETAPSPSSELEVGIRRISHSEYAISRDTINRALDNPRALQAQAPEFQQAYDNGNPNGIRLTRIPSGSIFTTIGIRQGDVLMEVNGSRITTPQRAMDLYDALQTESHVELTVMRRGRRRTITYDID